jgi:beta-xylosidase
MRDWRLFSSTDMVNWAQSDTWAGQVIIRHNKFYYYAPIKRKGASKGIGVGVSGNITGPYKDALGKPLVANGAIDPTV